MKIRRVFHHLLPLIFFVYCFALLSIPASADAYDDQLSYQYVFQTPYNDSSHADPNAVYPPNSVDSAYSTLGISSALYPYYFCFGAGAAGTILISDSPNLYVSGNSSWNRCTFSFDTGSTFYVCVCSYSNGWVIRPSNSSYLTYSLIYSSSTEKLGYQIYDNNFTVLSKSDNSVIDTPIVDENFEFELSAWTDYSVRGYASTNTENVYRVHFFVTPEPDLNASVDLIADDLFVYLSQLSDATLAESDRERIKGAFERQYPLVYEALEISGDKIVKAVDVIKNLAIGVTIPDSPLAGGLDYAVDLINRVRIITDSSYYGYRGFGGGYIGTTGTDFTINVLNFYSNVRNSPNYTDVNRVYAVFYSNTESEYPVAVLSSTFRVSDFFPTLTFPPLSVPSPSVIDGQPSTPNNSGTDWTIFQHAMYMQYLLDQLNRDFSISLKNYGDSLKLPDYAYTYDSTDLVPYDFDVSVPDVSAPDGLPLDLVRPVSFLGTLWDNILDSTGLSVIIPWAMIIGLVAWFFYGKN